MSPTRGNKITYFIVQVNTRDDSERGVVYSDYNGSIQIEQDIGNSTIFEDEKTALELAKLQNDVADLTSEAFSYFVVKEEVIRTPLTEDGEVIAGEQEQEESKEDNTTGEEDTKA